MGLPSVTTSSLSAIAQFQANPLFSAMLAAAGRPGLGEIAAGDLLNHACINPSPWRHFIQHPIHPGSW
jgi:hypothetical protein